MSSKNKKKRLTHREWEQIRKKWENDARDGFSWLVDEVKLDVSRQAIYTKSIRDGWSKNCQQNVNKNSVSSTKRQQNVNKTSTKRQQKQRLVNKTSTNENNQQPEIEQIIKDWIESIGGDKLDIELATTLFEKAKGFSHDSIHITSYQGEITITPITKYYPPDYKSIELMLKWRGLIDAERESSYEMPPQSVIDANREEARKLQEKWSKEQQERKHELISQSVCFEVDGDDLE